MVKLLNSVKIYEKYVRGSTTSENNLFYQQHQEEDSLVLYLCELHLLSVCIPERKQVNI